MTCLFAGSAPVVGKSLVAIRSGEDRWIHCGGILCLGFEGSGEGLGGPTIGLAQSLITEEDERERRSGHFDLAGTTVASDGLNVLLAH